MSKGVYRFFLNWCEDESPVEEIMKEEKRKSRKELSDWEFLDEWLRQHHEAKEMEAYKYLKQKGSYYKHPATGAAESIEN
mgnify:CR=1 FL=1